MITTLLLALALVAEEPKIIDGFIDGAEHPYVGALATRGSHGQYYAHCSAVMISDTIAITAAHCSWTGTDQIGDWRTTVSTSSVIDPQAEWKNLHAGDLYLMPGHDLALIVLKQPIWWPDSLALRSLHNKPRYARLPKLNELANRSTDQLTIVGYGVTASSQDANDYATTRRWGTMQYKSRGDHIMTARRSPSHPCWDDSGSAAFEGSSNVILGILSEVDGNCSGDAYYERVDTAEVRAWLAGHEVELP